MGADDHGRKEQIRLKFLSTLPKNGINRNRELDFTCFAPVPHRGPVMPVAMPPVFHKEDMSMPTDAAKAPNVKQAVPFFMVTDIEASLRFYVDGLGFAVTNEWRPEKAGGRVQWCWLQLGDAAMMLQEYRLGGSPGGAPEDSLGQGVSVCFMCADAIAIYHYLIALESPRRLLEMDCGLPR